jgi:phosphoribosylanthranilate isomerase
LNTKIKICGITNYEDAEKAVLLGADFLGFIQYPKSLRYLEFEKVSEIIQKIQKIKTDKDLKIVGVFVDQDLTSLLQIANTNIFDIFQLHGNEDFDYLQKLKDTGKILWKAFRLKDNSDLDQILTYKNSDKYLLDTFNQNLLGGTGEAFDWSIFDSFDSKNISKDKIILAGGIGLENITEALQKDIYAIDINSRIEAQIGKKDHEKMEKIFQTIRKFKNHV